jgi:putative membrane protein insertion efficiency factor
VADAPTPPRTFARILAHPLILGVRAYQVVLSPLMGGRCRFTPTCSHYAIDALRTHGAARGAWLAARRVCRCHPFGGQGYDPVPTREDSANATPKR